MRFTAVCFALLVVAGSAMQLTPKEKPASGKEVLVMRTGPPKDKEARKPTAFRGKAFAGIQEATLMLKVNGTEYPCGRPSKVKAFEMYRENLLAGVCSLPTANGMNCEASLECPLNQFFTDDCQGVKSAPKDVCDVCLYAHAMANASIGGTPYDGTWFYTYKKFFEGYMASSQLYTTIQDRYMLGKEIMCAAMIMVTDKCATGTNLPSCFQFSGRWFTGREHEGGDVNYGEELAAYGEEDKWATRDEESGTIDRTEINNILHSYGSYPAN